MESETIKNGAELKSLTSREFNSNQMKNFMPLLGVIIITANIMISCNPNSIKQKELALKERELALKEKELALKENDTSVVNIKTSGTVKDVKITEINKSSPNEKVMTMIFKDYSVGDNAYVVFNDIATGKEHYFILESGNESKFNGIKLLLEDDNAEFGEVANPKFINKTFIVKAILKTVLMNGPEGTTIKEKDWVINDLKLAK